MQHRFLIAQSFQAMTMPFRDPAEDAGYLRHFYKDWRLPLGPQSQRDLGLGSGLGLLPPLALTLMTRAHGGGRLIQSVLAPVQFEGERYLVSMLGAQSQWVQNVRAAQGDALIKRGRARRVRLTEMASDERAPILKAWCQVTPSGRRHLPVANDAPLLCFAAIAGSYPVFRIAPPR